MTEERQDFGGLELEKNMLGHRNQGCINEESDGLHERPSNLQSNNNDCSQTAWMPIPASLLPTCMDFNKLLYFSEPQHPPAKLSNNSTSFRTERDHA